MRHLPLLLGILVATAAMETNAQAQNYPWCAQYAGAGAAQRIADL